ncbi:MAG TPA: hemerythrin domain-containing protein [Candidatus Saccharimonadales bacterium]|nr:hemerythrin domain-containing protein [Candidatus Saccharimonadales bacterium]
MRFIKISEHPAKDASVQSDALEMLLGCHVRIRHFMQLGRTLAHAEFAPSGEIAETAEAISCYFSKALPLHEADENETLFPRLQAAVAEGNLVREAAETMVEQHKAIDELVADLLSLCDSLSQHPEALPSLARRIEDVTFALDKIFDAHLKLEETVIFPAILEVLTSEQLEEMSDEMRERRHPTGNKIHLVN